MAAAAAWLDAYAARSKPNLAVPDSGPRSDRGSMGLLSILPPRPASLELLVFDSLRIAIERQVQLNAVLKPRLQARKQEREALRGIGDVAHELVGVSRPSEMLSRFTDSFASRPSARTVARKRAQTEWERLSRPKYGSSGLITRPRMLTKKPLETSMFSDFPPVIRSL